jgi:hypothetical protein
MPHKKMSDHLKLKGQFGFKVKDAPEPTDLVIENWYRSRIITALIGFITFAFAVLVCVRGLSHNIPDMNDAFDDIPLYDECSIYDFSLVNATSYTTSTLTTITTVEKYCYCRSVGYENVEDTTDADTITLCDPWLDAYEEYYHSFSHVMRMMIFINVFTTYFFKLAFHPKIFCTRYGSTRFILTAIFV